MPDAHELYIAIATTMGSLLPDSIDRRTSIRLSFDTPIAQVHIDNARGGYELHYNPTAECLQDPKQREFIIMNECMHLIYLSTHHLADDGVRRDLVRTQLISEFEDNVRRQAAWNEPVDFTVNTDVKLGDLI